MKKNINDARETNEKSVLLSICIPTFNMADYLDEVLLSIFSQTINNDLKDRIEICISDNASSDHTDVVINKWSAKEQLRIVSKRNDQNIGFDNNLLQVVASASGQYCWTLGSDDKLEPGSIQHIITEIEKETGIDIFLLNQYVYDFHMKQRLALRLSRLRPLRRLAADVIYKDYNLILKECSYQFAYLSVLVFRRSLWERIIDDNEIINRGYIHLYRMLRLVGDGALVKYIARELVGWRSDNDAWANTHRIYGRFKYDIDGFSEIAKSVYGEASWEYNAIMRKLISTYIYERVLDLKINGEKLSTQIKIISLLFRSFKRYLIFWIEIIPLFFIPGFLFRSVKYVYRKTLRKARLKQLNPEGVVLL